jgi:UDP-N-acetylmuramoyl-tripeptide--D-alanyl-D-alanine ligase
MEDNLQKLYQIYLKKPVISKDSREKLSGGIYFSLKGEKFDGNEFAKNALENGASIAVIDNPKYKISEKYILVEDALATLQNLARIHRSKLNIPIIGITGSNGKTTTKELISTVLQKKYNTLFTDGNYNNHIGVPLTILKINNTHEIAVIEMGANHKKEIEFLCSISDPDFGLITNIGKAHLEGFGGVEGIKIGKSELYKHILAKSGLIFKNGDDEVLAELAEKNQCLNYGSNKDFFCYGKLMESHPTIKAKWNCKGASGEFSSKLYGDYNFYNMLAAITIGRYFDVEPKDIDSAITSYESDINRSQKINKGNYSIFLDAYNANPSSMEVAIKNFSKNNSSKKVVLLGDMFELGEDSLMEHQKIIDLCTNLEFNFIVVAGNNFMQCTSTDSRVLKFKSTEEAKKWFAEYDKENSEILIKGSRGMAMEKIIN